MLNGEAIGIVRAVLGLSLTCAGILGYSFRPLPGYVGSEKAIFSIWLYYTTLTLFLFAETLHGIIKPDPCLGISEVVFMSLLLYVTLCGLRFLRNVWMLRVDRVKDCLIYGSVVYLMENQIPSKGYQIVLGTILLTLAVCLVVLTGYIILRYRRFKLFLSFESYELVSIVYMTSFFIGLCAIDGELTDFLPYTLAIALNVYALYVIISRYVWAYSRL